MAEAVGAEIGLELKSTVGFGGNVHGGLNIHPDKKHVIYPLGSTVVVREIANNHKQDFLQGHTNTVSCVAVSKSGRFIASGQITHMGFQAEIIVWDFATRKLVYKFAIHKVKVQALAFSPNDKYLVSLGGQDDNSIILWDLAHGHAICGSPAAKESSGTALAVAYSNDNDDVFITGGSYTLRVWELDLANRKVRPTDCQLGQLKRVVMCIVVGNDNEHFFCGTTSGDVLQVNLRTKLFKHSGPQKEKLSMGVLSVCLAPNNDIVVGAGDGTVAIIKANSLKFGSSTKLDGAVTSITAPSACGSFFFAGTSQSNIYEISHESLTASLKSTCHYDVINDVAFPYGYSDCFATCSVNDIRVWNAKTSTELLRITVPNLECHAVCFTTDGKTIVSGWNDGKIRAFAPQSGRLVYVIHDAHNKGVTAVAATHDCKRLITGGGDGQVRVWRIGPSTQTMLGAMKEHKGLVTSICVRKNDNECVSSSNDGSCIIWDLERFLCNQVMFAATMFKSVCYHPDECQIVTGGTDRKVRGVLWLALSHSHSHYH
eukprot:Opistho-2@56123